MRFELKGVTFNYLDEGKGPVLVMLHGAGFNLHFWEYQVTSFRREYRVIRPDFRGHGETGTGNEPPGAPLFARDIIGLLDHLRIDKAALLGHSLGGMVALFAGADYPDRVNALVIADSAGIFPPINPAPPQIKEQALALINQGKVREALEISFGPGYRAQNPPLYDWLMEIRLKNRPEDIARPWKPFPLGISPAPLPTPDFGRIRCPTLFITGEKDQNLPVEYVGRAHRAVTGSKLLVLPTGHFAPAESPGPFNQAVADFLSQTGGN
jgi:pimeloyl-ACP methyl ester carboxylesterase